MSNRVTEFYSCDLNKRAIWTRTDDDWYICDGWEVGVKMNTLDETHTMAITTVFYLAFHDDGTEIEDQRHFDLQDALLAAHRYNVLHSEEKENS